MTRTKKFTAKSLILAILALVLVVSLAVGSVAWLTRTDNVTNTFTVGDVSKPTPNPGPGPKPDPDGPPAVLPADFDGYIYEPNWNEDNNKLIPGADLAKDPFVGIGANSEEAVVYVYVKNNFYNEHENYDHVGFTLESGWEAVDATKDATGQYYVQGLFKYSGTLQSSASANVWTATPVFKTIHVADAATIEELQAAATKTIVVSCFIHQAKNGNTDIEAAVIEKAAKDWVDTL